MKVRFRPSDAERWLHCHGAVPLQEKLIASGDIVPFTGNVYTREGESAHLLFNAIMRTPARDVDAMIRKHPAIGGFSTVEMRAPMRDAVDYATGWINRLGPDYTAAYEQRLPIRAIGGSGTTDMALISRSRMEVHVMDLKWGSGVPVAARGNPQLGLYALGLVPPSVDYTVHLHVIQPRADEKPMRHWQAPQGWHTRLDAQARAAIRAANGRNPPLTPSEGACRFCINKGHCPAVAKRALQDFKDHMPPKLPAKPKDAKPIAAAAVSRMTYAEMGTLLAMRPFVELFYAALAEAVWSALMQGKAVKHWKMVESRSQRQWKDVSKVVAAFKRKGISLDDFMPRTLVGITKGKALLDDARLMAALVAKAAGEPTIARDTDSRPALAPSDARKDFKL